MEVKCGWMLCFVKKQSTMNCWMDLFEIKIQMWYCKWNKRPVMLSLQDLCL